MNSLFWRSIATWIVGTSSIPFLFAGFARAQNAPASYAFVVASGFLCEGAESGSCPAIAESPTGGSYEISGAGTFDSPKKAVKAAGTFTHKSTNGNVLETGVWIASDLISFRSYGISPGRFLQKDRVLGRAQFSPKRFLSSRVLPTGGLAVLRISFVATTGEIKTAILQLNCALGDVPHERSTEGIRLSFDGSGAEFTEEAGARVMFLSMRTPVNGAVGMTHQGGIQKSAAAPPE